MYCEDVSSAQMQSQPRAPRYVSFAMREALATDPLPMKSGIGLDVRHTDK